AVRHVASPVETKVTPDHRFWVGDLSTARAAVASKGYVGVLEQPRKRGTSKLRWKQIGEAPGDTLLLPRGAAFELPDHFAFDLGEFARREASLDRYRRSIEDSYLLGYLFGTFLADGDSLMSSNGRPEIGRVAWSFGPQDEEIAQKLTDAV